MTAIRRAYVAVGDRLVHLRIAGAGRPLVLLHQSPRSSAELEPLIEGLAGRYLVIAPDTPGNGLSTPFPDRDPEIDPFADAVAALLDTLGIGRAGVYGYHTGAAIGAAFTLRYPERVAFAVLNGVPGFDAAERADLLAHYLPSFEPRWDGGHLTWLWARLREQTIHFPWHRTQPSARMDFDVPPAEALQAAAIDFMRAGDRYRDAYGAAFRLSGAAILPQLRVPAAIVATARDPLRPHLDRFAGLPAHLSVGEIEAGQTAVEALIDEMATGHDLSATIDDGQAATRFYAGPPGRQIHVCRYGRGDGRPLLLVDGRYGASGVIARVAAAVPTRTVLAACLPGCGESDTFAMGFDELAASLGVPDAERRVVGGHIAGSAHIGVPPERTGAHLLQAWHFARDGHLFVDGHRPERAGIRWNEAIAELAQIQSETLAILQQRQPVARMDRPPGDLDPNHWRR